MCTDVTFQYVTISHILTNNNNFFRMIQQIVYFLRRIYSSYAMAATKYVLFLFSTILVNEDEYNSSKFPMCQLAGHITCPL